MRRWHFALPARLCAGSAASRKLSELGVRGVFASLFDQGACSPKGDARTRTHSKSPATAGRNTTDKFAQAAKIFIDSSTDLTDGESSSCFVFMFSCFLIFTAEDAEKGIE